MSIKPIPFSQELLSEKISNFVNASRVLNSDMRKTIEMANNTTTAHNDGFPSFEEILKYCISKGWVDAVIYEKTRKPKSDVIIHAEQIKESLKSKIINLSPSDEYDLWHNKICLSETFGMRYGIWQKLINMTFKYLYCFKAVPCVKTRQLPWDKLHCPIDSIIAGSIRELLDFYHIPDDKQIIESISNNGSTNGITWNNINPDQYKTIQKRVQDLCDWNGIPSKMFFDFIYWKKRNFYLIPADYLTYDFNKLFNEEKTGVNGNSGRVLWKLNDHDAKIEVGGICYIYYSNLPDKTSRIILRGIVSASDSYNQDPESYLEKGQKCIELMDLETINWNNSEEYDFSKEALNDEQTYGIKINQTKRYLIDERKGGGDRKLCNDLEECFEHDENKLDLDGLKDEIVNKLHCVFNDNPEDKTIANFHNSFIQRNGLRYFEKHHLVLQKICRREKYVNDKKLLELVYSEENEFYLCPMCHRIMHFGCIDEIKEKIDDLYSRGKNESGNLFENNFIEYAKADGYVSVKKWIYHLYNIDENNTK